MSTDKSILTVKGHPCEDCPDSEVFWLDRSAGEVECQDCGSIYFIDEAVLS